MTKKIITIIFLLVLFIPLSANASPGGNWYIKDFQSDIIVNLDSSLTITERITADCPACTNKHGIFRVLPTKTKTPEESISTPIKLLSITDFKGNNLPHSESKNLSDNTITWKIGDPNKTVQDLNYYKITYNVKNAIRFQENTDELYWNLSGNFWDLQIDKFSALIHFPKSITEKNTHLYYYVGPYGDTESSGANYKWLDANTLQITADSKLDPKNGLTASITFPKNIFQPPTLTIWERSNLSSYLWALILPIITFIVCFWLWTKHGKDPKINKTIIALYEPPKDLSILEAITIRNDGSFSNDSITASIINFAVKGLIKIEQIDKKKVLGLVKDKPDFKLIKQNKSRDEISPTEKQLFSNIFEGQQEVLLSSLKKTMPKNILILKNKIKKDLIDKEFFTDKGFKFKAGLSVMAVFVFFLSLRMIEKNFFVGSAGSISGIILFVFGFLMTQKTLKGAESKWEIECFKHYMNVAEKYRQEFYEKENIFEKFLPYAIAFGMTKIWIKKMELIYGQDFYNNYMPAWYIGSTLGSFNAEKMTNSLSSISHSISSSVGTKSGSGGRGFSGGGGGGGGGGGW